MRGERVDRQSEGAPERHPGRGEDRPPRRPSARILAGLYAHELTRTHPPAGSTEDVDDPAQREPARAAAD